MRKLQPDLIPVRTGTDACATGSLCAAGSDSLSEVDHALVMHWNGTRWSKAASPNPGGIFNELFSVSAHAATDAWAVGDYENNTGPQHFMVLHWNGTRRW